VQGAGSTALRPFQIAATRIAQPFRDAYDYVDGLANAKSENAKLRKDVAYWRNQALLYAEGARQTKALARILHYRDGPKFSKGYRPVTARVISSSGVTR